MDGVHRRLALLFTPGMTTPDWERLGTILHAVDPDRRGDGDLLSLVEVPGKRAVDWAEVARQCEAMARVRARLVFRWEDEYSDRLREAPSSPPALFVRGLLPAPGAPAVAIVGTRKPSAAGSDFAHALARSLSSLGIVIVSGLARGIDTAAHCGALAAGGATIAVLGTGIDVVYPPENGELMDRIANEGAIVSEQRCGTQAFAHVFPRRNRIISGLSDAVVVVEGGAKSGALITAQWALEQGREVGAVPGFPGGFRSEGPNRLLKEGAFLVENAIDVVANVPRLMEYLRSCVQAHPSIDGAGLDGDAARVYDLAAGGASADDVASAAGIPIDRAQSLLAFLEIEGRIRRDEMGNYMRATHAGRALRA